jgi:hypothetical protein
MEGLDVMGDINHHSRFFANARPEWDLRYFSNSSALHLSGKAQYQTSFQGLNFAVCVDLPALWSECVASDQQLRRCIPVLENQRCG